MSKHLEEMTHLSPSVQSDNPITRRDEDRLERLDRARAFATQVMSLDVSEGLVVGVLGAWGSGKTSFINLSRLDLQDAGWKVVDFNPWMFSGAEQLVDSFFVELTAQLRTDSRFRDLADSFERYGEIFTSLGRLPVVGPWLELGRSIAKVARKEIERRKLGVASPREQVRGQLVALEHPIAVVIDDLDRLRTSEIRDIFKLVRLTASFPNLVYVLAFDRHRVETALAEESIPGRDYLEKILQLAVDLPAVPPDVLTRETAESLDVALADLENRGPFKAEVWPDVLMEIVRPLIRNMRDVKRYAGAVRGTVVVLRGQVELVDVLALEAIRVFVPDVFAMLPVMMELLTTPTTLAGGPSADPSAKEAIQNLVDAAGAHGEIVRRLIFRVFPAAQRHLPQGMHYTGDWVRTWLKDRRVAHRDILRFYLENVVGQELTAFMAAERAFAVLDDPQELDSFLRSLPGELRVDAIAGLENWEEEYPSEAVAEASAVLLNLIPDLPEREQGLFGVSAKMKVDRVVYRLLRSLRDPNMIHAAVVETLPLLHSLSAKLSLITYVGHREGAGHKLIDESESRSLEAEWREDVRNASASELIREWDLLRILFLARHEASPDEPNLQIPDDPWLSLAIFRAALGEVRAQTLGNRTVRRSHRLAWDALVEVFGNQEVLEGRSKSARAVATPGDSELIELVSKYLTGWRPSDFDS